MTTPLKIIAALVALPFVVLIGGFIVATAYSHWFTYVHYFRMTVEVETPDGIKSGSSVLKAVYVESPKWIPQEGHLNASLHGEAVFVDLGNGKNVVALLARGANGEVWMGPDLAARALRGEGPEKVLPTHWYRDAPNWTGQADLTDVLMPTFASFGDVTRPETVRVIQPYQLEYEIGPGYRLLRVWVDLKRDRYVGNIEDRLPWMQQIGNREYVGWAKLPPEKGRLINALKVGAP